LFHTLFVARRDLSAIVQLDPIIGRGAAEEEAKSPAQQLMGILFAFVPHSSRSLSRQPSRSIMNLDSIVAASAR
jgi:hypothetical protein